ncbi:receptor expression-enhancing protein 3 [Pseudoliparis swirei]|uniref:receptor expression-enhancing protein 3 n=1 Tax=Pseudoliparis swirei TaxID=2059687 RepID=UPI0024BEDEDF|nr:receptor expression-enhancing protein 3 [Pseudoliparis swirei]
MVSWIISRTVVLFFGTLYPAYYSYKAVKTKNVKEYVRWMMYWIVFALYTVVETVTDLTLTWFPLYYELKIAFVIWLLSPYTRGASLIYRKCLHPLLSSREREIDEYIVQAKERSYETMVHFGKQGLSIAATAAVTAAVKGQGAITEKLRSLSMHDLTQIGQQDNGEANQLETYGSRSTNPAIRRSQSTEAADGDDYFYDQDERSEEEAEPIFSEDEAVTQKGLRRSQSVKITRSKVRRDARYGSLKIKGKKRPVLSAVNYGV